MRYLLMVIFLIVIFNLFGQKNNDVDIFINEVDNAQVFTFDHNVDYFYELENRLLTYPNREEKVIESLTISNYKCKVVFNNKTSDKQRDEALLFVVNGLGYDNFNLKL